MTLSTRGEAAGGEDHRSFLPFYKTLTYAPLANVVAFYALRLDGDAFPFLPQMVPGVSGAHTALVAVQMVMASACIAIVLVRHAYHIALGGRGSATRLKWKTVFGVAGFWVLLMSASPIGMDIHRDPESRLSLLPHNMHFLILSFGWTGALMAAAFAWLEPGQANEALRD